MARQLVSDAELGFPKDIAITFSKNEAMLIFQRLRNRGLAQNYWAPGCILDSNRTYKTDFGYGGTMLDIGKAKQIWLGQAWVTNEKLAKAKGVSEASITLDDIAEMKRRLRGEFTKAEKARDKWKPIPVTVPPHSRGCP